MFKHTIITSGDEKALAEALEQEHDGNASVMKVGQTIMATVESTGWRHTDEAILSELERAGKIGVYRRTSERNS